jgi:hypothetical protein
MAGGTVPGAVETLIRNVNYAGAGPVLIWRGGSKATFQKFNAEAHGPQVWPPGVAPAGCFFCILNDHWFQDVHLQTNGITLDGITLGDQTATTGGGGTQYSQLVYLQHAFASEIRRVNGYSSQPAAGPPTCSLITLGTDTAYNFMVGPFTRQALSGFGAIANLIEDGGRGNYGVNQNATGNPNATAIFDTGCADISLRFRKSTDGHVALSGTVAIDHDVHTDRMLPDGAARVARALLTLPDGFRPAVAQHLVAATDAAGDGDVFSTATRPPYSNIYCSTEDKVRQLRP